MADPRIEPPFGSHASLHTQALRAKKVPFRPAARAKDTIGAERLPGRPAHALAAAPRCISLKEGDKVSFETENDTRGRGAKAAKVELPAST